MYLCIFYAQRKYEDVYWHLLFHHQHNHSRQVLCFLTMQLLPAPLFYPAGWHQFSGIVYPSYYRRITLVTFNDNQ
jgi:hypothetical protein